MFNNKIIDEALAFYNLEDKYKDKCYKCLLDISKNDKHYKAFQSIYQKLYFEDISGVRELWKLKSIDELFIDDINPFVTNLIVLLGYQVHKNNMDKYHLTEEEKTIHKRRVKETFENDLINRGYDSIRISQMLWGAYLIRLRIIEVGRLQYEYYKRENEVTLIKIHIPKGSKLDIDLVKKSIHDSKEVLKRIYNVTNIKYLCNSWLLSNQIYKIIDVSTNIAKFHNLFDIIDGEECTSDILNFLYELKECRDYSLLKEDTSLRKIVKEELIKGTTFYLGLGILKQDDSL